MNFSKMHFSCHALTLIIKKEIYKPWVLLLIYEEQNPRFTSKYTYENVNVYVPEYFIK